LLMARLNAAQALSVLQNAVRLQPDDAEAHNLLGATLAAVGRFTDAIAQFQLALRARPDYSNARLNLANAFAKSGRLPEAIENFRQILRDYPEDATAKKLLARTLTAQAKQFGSEERTRYSEALRELNEALSLDPSLDEARQARDLVEQHLAH